MSKQRLIILFDGTWNDPEDQTNVYRLARRIKDHDGSVRQRFFYDPGVGTSRLSRFRGGAFGYGLSANLLKGYDWLVRRYAEGDEIWIFGFSRGAYTARSLVGLIRKCGLLHIVTPRLLKMAESLYRDKSKAPDGEPCVEFRQRYSRMVRIHFIGVWDTVGCLGIPGTFFSEFGRYSWHDTELSSIVDYAYHAVALDEFRKAYDTALWTSEDGSQRAANKDVQQRWFIGAHANVGGGYGVDPLADISLQWILGHAHKAGLKTDILEAYSDAWRTDPRPSYKEFLGGFYAFYRKLRAGGKGEYSRSFATGHLGKPAVNVSVDDSVWRRWQAPEFDYRPPTLTNADRVPPT